MASAYEIRRLLKIYDDAAIAPLNRAVTMLKEVTKLISESPDKYDLTSGDAETWAEAGGLSYAENAEFPCALGERWMETLSKPGVAKAAGLDKVEWATLLKDITAYEEKLVAAELSLEVLEELTELINKLIEEAPEPEDSDEDDEDDDEDSDDE
ncbi:hypothetical protein HYH02_000152 [Chlamydomonas schloesseri]|uniref:Uncharacterized protein n=1 Tax=Chlamydomonas schloesseri TaxID=2026947 RepID=A0A835WMN8_9CHLO|nr:hypothetical protein HYH02_000152 [Chlamydomonas schloesseri]|eukprot:KAG2450048.1 hypothetical protein HYH02_000152 [Chlamydomonas schloesseri]